MIGSFLVWQQSFIMQVLVPLLLDYALVFPTSQFLFTLTNRSGQSAYAVWALALALFHANTSPVTIWLMPLQQPSLINLYVPELHALVHASALKTV
jgi:hypothetical protein